MCPRSGFSLIFFSWPFWKTARKTTKQARISSACRTSKILGKEGKNAQNRKEFLEKEKGKDNQKGKEKKISPDPPILAFLEKARVFPQKQGFFSSRNPQNPLKSLEKTGKTHKKQGKSDNEKSKENEKSKDWRVREGWYRGTSACTLVPFFGTGGNIRMYPRSRFLVSGNIRMYPRSGFSVPESIRQNHPFSAARKKGASGKGPRQKTSKSVKVARLQSEFCTKDFFRATNFRTKNAPKFSPNFSSLCSVGQKKSPENSLQISHKIFQISLRKIKKKSPTSFCRSAGRKKCQKYFSGNLNRALLERF